MAEESGDDLNMKLLTGTISQNNALIRQVLPMMMMIIIITITIIIIIWSSTDNNRPSKISIKRVHPNI